MKERFRAVIEDQYSFTIADTREGSRGQVADETHILRTSEGRQYFCKITKRADFKSLILPTLPVVREMYEKGLKRLCAPLPAKNGLAIEVDDALIVIFDFISADTGFDYDLQHFGKTLGDVHVLTAELKNQLPSRGFSSSREDFFNETIPRLTSHQTGDDVTKALSGILQQYSDETNAIIDAFFRLKSLCTKKPVSFVNTHGDVHGNVLVRTPHDFYIIDWDEMEKGPAERDLWFLSEKPEFMHGYRLARPDFVLDADAAKHALLKNYLEGIAIFVMPILDRRLAPETRLKKIQVLENKRLNGWMKPRIREIICAGPYEDPT